MASYPFDTTGTAESNLIRDELHTLTEVNAAPQRILIPKAAPFYLNNLLAEHISQQGVATPLTEGVDFYCALPYVAASRSVGKPVFGGFAMISDLPQGTIRLTRYQTVGGPWVANRDYVYEQLLATVYNKRTAWWDSLTNVQQLFPPTDHEQPVDDVEGHEAMLVALGKIEQALLANPGNLAGLIAAHIQNIGNPHQVTKNDVGLADVANFPMATDQEVVERANVDKYITLRQLLLLINQL